MSIIAQSVATLGLGYGSVAVSTIGYLTTSYGRGWLAYDNVNSDILAAALAHYGAPVQMTYGPVYRAVPRESKLVARELPELVKAVQSLPEFPKQIAKESWQVKSITSMGIVPKVLPVGASEAVIVDDYLWLIMLAAEV